MELCTKAPGRQAKHQAQGDRRLDGVVRVLALSAWLPACRPRRVPVGELAIGESEPDGQTPASAETRLVLPPIPDTVGLLDVLPLGALETRHAGPRISGWRAIIDRDRELCTKAAPWQDILDLAYYSGWRKQEILGLTWEEIDEAGGVIRLSPGRSKTLVGRILPISPPIAEALARRRARRDPDSPLVFHRDGITIRRWRTAWRTACQAAGVPTRFLHDCRRTAARNLIRANVPERVAMLLTGHKSRAIFDRYNIIHEQELLDAGDQLVEYLAQQAQAVPARRRPHTAGPAAPRTASPLRLVRRGTA